MFIRFSDQVAGDRVSLLCVSEIFPEYRIPRLTPQIRVKAKLFDIAKKLN